MKLVDLASTIRSKNAGIDHLTFDILFRERANFERVRDSGVLTRDTIATTFNVPASAIVEFVIFEPANAIKTTISREYTSGTFGDADVFGSQQYAPLFELEVP